MASLYALVAAASPKSTQDMIIQILPYVAIGIIFYFLLIRPQQKRAREHQEILRSLKRGDVIITQGGIIGKIVKLDEQDLTLEIAENVRIKILRGMILQLKPSVQKQSAIGSKKPERPGQDKSGSGKQSKSK